MFKKISILIISLLLLTSCGWDDILSETSWLKWYNWEWYSIFLPSNWNIMTDKNNILPEPSEW
jgi:hypothetical protein